MDMLGHISRHRTYRDYHWHQTGRRAGLSDTAAYNQLIAFTTALKQRPSETNIAKIFTPLVRTL
ncbi:hypothetical protein J6590_071733 [Homalodisca vitripennis]|nr:hypothetical protein J6590_071733 [Homalodisca vitripennis]